MRVGIQLNVSVDEAAAIRKVLKRHNLLVSDLCGNICEVVFEAAALKSPHARERAVNRLVNRVSTLRVMFSHEYTQCVEDRKRALRKRLGDQPDLPFGKGPEWWLQE